MKIAVIGAGIAGLSIASQLQSNGHDVTLLDKNDKPGGEASRSTQNWYHTGWLYAAAGANKPKTWFSGLAKNTIASLQKSEKYFKEYFPTLYNSCVKKNDFHYLYPKLFSRYWYINIFMHLVAFPRIKKFNLFYKKLKNWENKTPNKKWVNEQDIYLTSDGYLDTIQIMSSMYSLFLRKGGKFISANEGVSLNMKRPGLYQVIYNNIVEDYDYIVCAVGYGTQKLLRDINLNELSKKVITIYCPITVTEDLKTKDFIRYVINPNDSINHHKVENKSTIGDATYSTEPVIPSDFIKNKIKNLIGDVKIENIYIAHKTEYVGSGERNYEPVIKSIGENAVFALPGKFSQFPLLLNKLKDFIDFEIKDIPLCKDKSNVLQHYANL